MSKLYFLFTLLLVSCIQEKYSQKATINQQISTPKEQERNIKNAINEINGIYFGIATRDKQNNAWLLKLDFNTNDGALYTPYRVLKIKSLRLLRERQITFQTEPDAEIVTKFSGTLEQNNLNGVFTSYRTSLGNLEYVLESNVSLQRIHLDTKSICDYKVTYCGKYSNIKYNEDSGDLNGEELVIIPHQSKGYSVIFTSYSEGGMPVAAKDFKVDENKITFFIERDESLIKYTGSIKNGRLILTEYNLSAVHHKRQLTLKAISPLDHLFAFPHNKK